MKKSFFTLIFFIAAIYAIAQSDKQTQIKEVTDYMAKAMRFNLSLPQEKAYLHFDNTGYFIGETMYFKAYVTRTDTGQPTDISKILYVDILNPTGDVVTTHKLQINDGLAMGDIKLDTLLGSGFYEVRAYTRYMTNYGNAAAFSRVFPVFNTPKSEGDYSKKVINEHSVRHRLPDMREGNDEKLKKLNIRLYPEGGDLVSGLPARVAFLVTDGDGLFTDATGYTTDIDGNKIDDVETVYEGKGSFLVSGGADASKPAYLVLQDKKGKEAKVKLPEFKNEGCTMMLDVIDNDNVSVEVHSSPAMLGRMLGYTLLNNGNTLACDTITAEPSFTVAFPRAELPAGVSQLVLFDSDGHIHADRLFFIMPKSNPDDTIKAVPLTESLSPCSKVEIELQARPNSSISFSAMDAATLTNGLEGNALTWMLLSSEVKGYIHNPDYYFEADDNEHRVAADLLMLVQGWRRYDWQLMTGLRQFEKMQPAEDMLSIFGQLRSNRKRRQVSGVELKAYLFNASGQVVEGLTKTDSIGFYKFAVPDIESEWNLQIQSLKEGEPANYIVCIDRHFSPEGRKLSPYESMMIPIGSANMFNRTTKTDPEGEYQENYVPLDKRVIVLPNVKIKAHRALGDFRVTWFDENEGKRYADLYYNCDIDADKAADQGEPIPAFTTWLNSRNNFFEGDFESNFDSVNRYSTISRNDMEGGQINIGGLIGPTYRNMPIVWIVDNTFCAISGIVKKNYTAYDVNNNTNIVEVPFTIDEVKSVYISENTDKLTKYIMAPSITSSRFAVIYVYRHPKFLFNRKGLRRTHFAGYNSPSTFEMEDYSVVPPMEDFRRTIFWAPDVRTDEKGKAKVEFFNNSSAKQMFISAEGMTPEGKLLILE